MTFSQFIAEARTRAKRGKMIVEFAHERARVDAYFYIVPPGKGAVLQQHSHMVADQEPVW